MKPTHLHYTNQDGRLCGEPVVAWSDKYMTDAFARTLPRCPKCLEIAKANGTHQTSQTIYTAPKSIPEPVAPKPIITLSHYLD